MIHLFVTSYILAACVFLLFSPDLAWAQQPASSFDKMPVKAGDTISVIHNNGKLNQGSIVDLSATSLSLRIGETTRHFSPEDVSEIRQRRSDPLWNGLIVGAGVGFALGIVGLFAVDGNNQARKTGFGLMIAGGAGLGIGLDAKRKGQVVIFRAPNRSSSSVNRIRLVPLASGNDKGLMVSVSF